MKTRLDPLALLICSAPTATESVATAARPARLGQRRPVAQAGNRVNRGNHGHAGPFAWGPGPAAPSTLVDALIEQLREARMKRCPPH